MSEDTSPGQPTTISINTRERAEPQVLKLAEEILSSSDAKGVSEQLDVASIFYTAVATIVGSLAGAGLYLWLSSIDSSKYLALWLVFLSGAMIVGGLLGFAVVAIIFNARGYTRWQRKYRPDERS